MLIGEINDAEWFRVKSPSLVRCKDGDLPLLNFVCMQYSGPALRYLIHRVRITGKFLNGYPMFCVENVVQKVKLIELWGKNW